jgi:hypothetical protein
MPFHGAAIKHKAATTADLPHLDIDQHDDVTALLFYN